MRMVDLFCGRGGWTKGFMAEGWECTGYDLNPQPDYPGNFAQWDVLTMTAYDLRDADFICASSPCEQFSVHGMKCFHPKPKFPEMGIELFFHTKRICEQSGKPFVMENVRSAQKFVGPAVNHCGPFYLWGNAVPAIMPKSTYQVTKGLNLGYSMVLRGLTPEQKRLERKKYPILQTSSSSPERAEVTAKAAEIPLIISQYIAQQAANLIGAIA